MSMKGRYSNQSLTSLVGKNVRLTQEVRVKSRLKHGSSGIVRLTEGTILRVTVDHDTTVVARTMDGRTFVLARRQFSILD